MKSYAYDFEIETLVTQFISALDDVIVKRYNKQREPEQQIKVRFVYAPKQRVLNDLLDKAQNIQLPVVACYIQGLGRDANRVVNKIQGSYQSIPGSSGQATHEQQPLPVDLQMGVTVMTRFQSDMDQILSSILSYFDPYIVVSWRTPGRPNNEIKSQIIWGGNAQIAYPYDINSAQNARVVADLSFTIKGWLFKAKDTDGVGLIETIHTLYSNGDSGIPCEYTVDQFVIDSRITEFFTLSGTPPQPLVIEPTFTNVGIIKQFAVTGRGIKNLQNVYLSGDPLSADYSFYNPFSASELSAVYPGFSAVKLDASAWTSDNDVTVTFAMPSAASPGFVDVILEGPVGYGNLTQFVRRNTFNPFLSTDPYYLSYVPYQVPYLSGIEVV